MNQEINSIPTPNVYIEGTDLTGKDSIGEAVTHRFSFSKFRHLSIVADNPYDQALNEAEQSGSVLIPAVIARAILFDIRNYTSGEGLLLLSSHAFRAAAFAKAGDLPLADEFEELLKYYPMLEVNVLLQASLSAKKTRLANRSHKSSKLDQKIYTDPDFVSRMDEYIATFARAYFFNGALIDTSSLSISEVSGQIIDLIGQNQLQTRSNSQLVTQNTEKKLLFERNAPLIENSIRSFERSVSRRQGE